MFTYEENPSKFSNKIFLKGFYENEHGLISKTFIYRSLGFVQKPIFFLSKFKRKSSLVPNSKCAPKEEAEKLKMNVLVKWFGKDWLA